MTDEVKVITQCKKCKRAVWTIHVDVKGACCNCESDSDFREFGSGGADVHGSEEVTPVPTRTRKRTPATPAGSKS